MPDEVTTKSLEEELDEFDDLDSDIDAEVDADTHDEGGDDDEGTAVDASKTEGESDDGKQEGKEEEEIGEETPDEEDTSGTEGTKSEEEGEEGSEASETVDDQQRIVNLVAEIDRLSGLVAGQTKIDSPVAKPVADSETIKIPPTVDTSDEEDFVGSLDMDDVASDPKILNKLLNAVLKKGIAAGQALSASQIDSSISKNVMSQVESFNSIKTTIDQFYDNNDDLSSVRQVVKACAVQISKEQPDKKLEDILELAADAARKTLGIVRKKEDSKTQSSKSAAFAEPKGGQRKKAKKLSKLQQELDEL